MNFISKYLKSQGMSLVEVTMAVGLLGVAAVTAIKLTETTTKGSQWAEMSLLKAEFASSFGKYVASSAGCGDLKLSGPFNLPKNLEFNWKVAGLEGNPLNMKAGREFKYFKVTEISSGIAQSEGGLLVLLHDGQKGQRGFLDLKLSLQVKANLKRSDNDAKVRDYTYKYKIPIVYDPITFNVLDCFENQSLQSACDVIGGSIINGICKPPAGQECKFSYSYYTRSAGYSGSTFGLPECQTGNCCSTGVPVSTGAHYNHYIIPATCGKSPCNGKGTGILTIYSCLECGSPSTIGTVGGGSTLTGGSYSGGMGGGSVAGSGSGP